MLSLVNVWYVAAKRNGIYIYQIVRVSNVEINAQIDALVQEDRNMLRDYLANNYLTEFGGYIPMFINIPVFTIIIYPLKLDMFTTDIWVFRKLCHECTAK